MLVCASTLFFACGKTKVKLDSPSNMVIQNNMLIWDAVEKADGYMVSVDGEAMPQLLNSASYSLEHLVLEKSYTIKVKAIGKGLNFSDSDWSEPIEYFTDIVYTLNFDKRGGSGEANSKNITPGGTYGALPEGVVRTGYTFGGWFTEIEGGGTNITAETTVSAVASQTVFAKWIAHSYTVNYDANGGVGSAAATSHIYGVPQLLPNSGFERENYNLSGWSLTAQTNGVYFPVNAPAQNIAAEDGAEVTLYAVWTPIEFNIHYDLSGGTNHSSNPEIYNFECGDIVLYAPTKAGYSFEGWQEGDTIFSGSTGDKTFTAQWLPKRFIITYNYQDGSGNAETEEVLFGSYYTLLIPYREGYNFGGWYIYVNDERIKLTDSDGYSLYQWEIASDTTIYAYWEGTTGLKYTPINGETEYSVSQGTSVLSGVVVIPEFYNGKKVTQIDYRAFYGCTQLTEVVISTSITSIGNQAFWGTALISNAVDEAVYVGNWAVGYKGDIGDLVLPDTTYGVADGAFANCLSITSVILPENVQILGENAFYGCVNLLTVELPAGLRQLPAYAFGACNSLETIYLPESLTSIGHHAFSFCIGLKSVIIPDSVTEIGSNAFRGCSSMESIVLPDKLDVIEGYLLSGCKSLKIVNIPDSVTAIGGDAFRDCELLTYIRIPAWVSRIGRTAFLGCKSLEKIIIEQPSSSGIIALDRDVFYGCSGLLEIIVPNAASVLAYRAASGWDVYAEIIKQQI